MPENEKSSVKLSLPLDFQQDIFRELRNEDVLLILARGLGLLRIVTNLLHSYDAAGNNLVIVVGAEERENGWLGEALAERAVVSNAVNARGLTVINTDLSNVVERERLYKRGGIFSVTSRILVVDLLSGLLNPEVVTGLVILHADRVVVTSNEAFITRIYRQKNKKGFLKAFSDNPGPFTIGFAPLANMMRNLFLRRPSLWPRFQETVAKSLEGKKKAEVIELEVPMTEGMLSIQNAVLECIDVSIKELRKSSTGVDMEEWTIDSALHRNFDAIVRRQLDPVWHRTSFRTRQIVRDLVILRNLLEYILTYDAVSFNKYLDIARTASSPPSASSRQQHSPWLFLDAADTIFTIAKQRVYSGKIKDGETVKGPDALPESLRPVLEEQPKWEVLADALDEIEQENYLHPNPQDNSSGAVLIMCSDGETCRQVREYLQTMHVMPSEESNNHENGKHMRPRPSARFMLRRKLRNYLAWKQDFAKVNAFLYADDSASNGSAENQKSKSSASRAPPNKRRRVRGSSASAGYGRVSASNWNTNVAGDRDSHVASLIAELEPNEIEAEQKREIATDPLEDTEDYYQFYDFNDLVIVHPYDGDMDEHILEELKPRYIIMYEPDAAFIRRVEVYRSSHTDRAVKVFFMYYGASVEEQRYLSAVRREKDAFTKLIRERSTMSITLTADASGVEDPQERFLRTINTRIAGGGRLAATASPPLIVVDVREFRSSLPPLLHANSIIVIPSTLTVGDYVLTPDICVERKSVNDLISSFNNGRLYNQAETMLQHYKSPYLLIEFDKEKSFTLEPFADLSMSGASSFASLNPATASDLQSKLVLLTIAFPRLKIIWSSSPDQTAKIFEELKNKQDEPNPEIAATIGLEPGEDVENRTFNTVTQDMLRSIPGVNPKNMSKLMLKVENLIELSNMEEDSIAELVGREAARQIYRFFNRSIFEE